MPLLKVGRPVLTHGHRSTWCENKARLFPLVILFKMTRTVHKQMCVCVGIEKTFVRFYEFLFYFACSEIQFFFPLPQGNVAQ